jgi:hypothetical protein
VRAHGKHLQLIEPIRWASREFTFDLSVGAFPALLERLHGTPARAAELVCVVPEKMLGHRINGKWSVNHRQSAIQEILRGMRAGRHLLLERLKRLTSLEIILTAIHPRLRKRMRLLDWAYLVAEHDDHHLAHARKAIQEQIGI